MCVCVLNSLWQSETISGCSALPKPGTETHLVEIFKLKLFFTVLPYISFLGPVGEGGRAICNYSVIGSI